MHLLFDASSQTSQSVKLNFKSHAANVHDMTTRLQALINETKTTQLSTAAATTPAKKKQPKPKTSSKQDALQTTLDVFISNTIRQAQKLSTSTTLHATSADGSAVAFKTAVAKDRVVEEDIQSKEKDFDEAAAAEEVAQRRTRNRSSTSVYAAEASNVHSKGAADSDISQPDDSAHASDEEFVSNTPMPSQDQSLHPRFLAAREAMLSTGCINSPVSRNKKINVTYCAVGHKVNVVVKMTKRATKECHYCQTVLSKDNSVHTCYCYNMFVCDSCISKGESFRPPPLCVMVSCQSHCTLKKIQSAPSKNCAINNCKIARGSSAWFCSDKECKSIICKACHLLPTLSQTIAILPSSITTNQVANSIQPIPPQPPLSSEACPPTIAMGLPAPMPASKRL